MYPLLATSEKIFNLLPLDWMFFSTVGTFSAVFVAIVLPIIRDRNKIKLQAMIGSIKNEEISCISLTIRNLCKNQIMICNWGLWYPKKIRKARGCTSLSFDMLKQLPLRLPPGEVGGLSTDYFIPGIPYAKTIYVIDGAGKYWFLPKKKFEYIQNAVSSKIPKKEIV